ncbi:MAG: hypothetical protein MI976_02660, partial [Pseudomonadales bacterium]|nr:hypothetical protein [Pseudomonadales bacterium]
MLCIIMRLWLVSLVLLYFLGDRVFAAEINLSGHSQYFFDVEDNYSIANLASQNEFEKSGHPFWQQNK